MNGLLSTAGAGWCMQEPRSLASLGMTVLLGMTLHKAWSFNTKLQHKLQNKKPRPEGEAVWCGRSRPANLPTAVTLLDFDRLDHHELAHRSLVQEFDAPRDLGEEGIVFAATDVQSGLGWCAALAHNDGAAGHDLPAECLKPKPLRV